MLGRLVFMEDHLILFIDFVGFADVNGQWNSDGETRLNSLIELQSLGGEFDLNEEAEESGKRFRMRPAISTFSDDDGVSTGSGSDRVAIFFT